MISAPPLLIRSAASAIACNPELQNRLMVMPVTSPAGLRAKAIAAPCSPGLTFRHCAPQNHVLDTILRRRIPVQ
jgi:hypothetical protein